MSCRDERGWREPESAPLSRKRGPSGVQYLFSNLLPYNARHLIAIEFDDQVNHDLLLLSPEIRKKAQRKAANVDEETSKLSPLPKTRGHDDSRYGMLPAKPPRGKAVATNGVMWSSSRQPPAKGLCVRVSWEAGIHKRSLQRWCCKYKKRACPRCRDGAILYRVVVSPSRTLFYTNHRLHEGLR